MRKLHILWYFPKKYTSQRILLNAKRFFSHSLPLAGENALGLFSKFSANSPLKQSPASIARMQRGLPAKRRLENIKNVIAVASGKGGVGKSTTTVNLALAVASLSRKRVGILDADLFGPSLPRLMNLKGEPNITDKGQLIPLINYGVKCMSMGFLVSEDAPVVWRGLMVMKALQQLLHQVYWGELDLLIIDMPPGTGDTQLTITQQVELDGVVIVSTPQDIALIDAKKGANMFRKVGVPIIGIMQNMSYFLCPNCHQSTHIFGNDGASRTAKEMGIDILGDVPLHADICELSDLGQPIVIAKPDSHHTKCYMNIAQRMLSKMESSSNH
ncbi:hypothetical protein G9A89_012015 [Geosiphon pyriformis]|nr:hypothetical protein G9A89_012015 [Geosiphon pyriformis]